MFVKLYQYAMPIYVNRFQVQSIYPHKKGETTGVVFGNGEDDHIIVTGSLDEVAKILNEENNHD